MTKPELLKRLEVLVDQMKSDHAFGQISIAFRDGEPDYLRKETTEKLGVPGNTHANKPSYRKPAKPRPTRIDDITWKLFVDACGGRCCSFECDGTATKLQQGHLESHNDGGLLVIENAIPLCASCNGKYGGRFTRDTRPEGWRDKFYKSWLAANGVEMRVLTPSPILAGGVNTLLGEQVVKNKHVIDLQTVEFALSPSYITPCVHTPSPHKVSIPRATKLMWKLFEKSRDYPIPPKPPLEKKNAPRQTQLIRMARWYGEKDFLLIGRGFLAYRPAPWVTGTEEYGHADADSWQHMCNNPKLYLEEGRKLAAADARHAKALERQRREWEQRNRESRWETFTSLAAETYPDTREDDEFVKAVLAEKEAGVLRDVSDDELQRMRNAVRSGIKFWREHVMKNLLGLYKQQPPLPFAAREKIIDLYVEVRDRGMAIATMLAQQDKALAIAYCAELAAAEVASKALDSSTAEDKDEEAKDSDIPF